MGRKAEEYIVQLAALKKQKIIAFCNRNLYDYLVRNDSDSHDIKPKYRVDNIQAISEALDICRRDFRCEEEWAFRWLCALLHEFYSVSEFAKEEKKNITTYLSMHYPRSVAWNKYIRRWNSRLTVLYMLPTNIRKS